MLETAIIQEDHSHSKKQLEYSEGDIRAITLNPLYIFKGKIF